MRPRDPARRRVGSRAPRRFRAGLRHRLCDSRPQASPWRCSGRRCPAQVLARASQRGRAAVRGLRRSWAWRLRLVHAGQARGRALAAAWLLGLVRQRRAVTLRASTKPWCLLPPSRMQGAKPQMTQVTQVTQMQVAGPAVPLPPAHRASHSPRSSRRSRARAAPAAPRPPPPHRSPLLRRTASTTAADARLRPRRSAARCPPRDARPQGSPRRARAAASRATTPSTPAGARRRDRRRGGRGGS